MLAMALKQRVTIDANDAREAYSGDGYSTHGTHYSLFVTKTKSRPAIKMSWEHSSYVWLDHIEFLETARGAKDAYMHMVYSVLKTS